MYRAAVLRLQQQMRRMPSVSLAGLRFSLQEFKAGALLCCLPRTCRGWQALNG